MLFFNRVHPIEKWDVCVLQVYAPFFRKVMLMKRDRLFFRKPRLFFPDSPGNEEKTNKVSGNK